LVVGRRNTSVSESRAARIKIKVIFSSIVIT